jgi:hypothetical protein
MSDDSSYDIFAVDEDGEGVWQCSFETLASANKKMEELARNKPSKYFVFSTSEDRIVARFDVPTRGPAVEKRRLSK